MNKAVEIAEKIKSAQDKIAELRVSQGRWVAMVAKNDLYTEHPNPKAQKSLRQYLKHACGLGKSSVSELAGFGGKVIPFCDRHNIDISRETSKENWSKMRDALVALKNAIDANDVNMVKSILKDVREAPTRLWIRHKYHNAQAAIGHGFTTHGDNGELILVARMNEGVTKDKLIGRLGNLLDLSDSPRGFFAFVPVMKPDETT